MPVDQIKVTYRVVTPLFCGGADPAAAEVRLPSFKGVLRWWWRALAWARYEGDLGRIHDAESALFGSAGGGQSKIAMRLVPSAVPKTIACGETLMLGQRVVGEGARYLGYGVMGAFGQVAGRLTRACLAAPFELSIELRGRDLAEPQRELLLDALRAVGVLGGIGAKSRKGYGSLVLRSMTVGGKSAWSPPMSAGALKQCIAELLRAGRPPAALPDYTAMSPRARVVLVPGVSSQTQPLELLNRIGREMMRYRSWGHNGRVLEFQREENFRDDHDLMIVTAPGRRTRHPRRIAFGLPHNYRRGKDYEVRPADGGDRRASPLLVHLHECDEAPVAVLTFLPAVFLPGGDRAKINVGEKHVAIAPDPELWQPINDLLARFLAGPPARKEPFGKALEVRP